jgi:acetyl-CoA acetyltransferase
MSNAILERFEFLTELYCLYFNNGSAVRTPICRGGKGGFKDMYPEDLLAVILKAAAERAKIDPKIVNDIQTGNVLQELGGIKVGRAAMFAAGMNAMARSRRAQFGKRFMELDAYSNYRHL